MKKHFIILSLFACTALLSCGQNSSKTADQGSVMTNSNEVRTEAADYVFNGEKITKTDEEWKKLLTRDQYYILREQGTDQPFHNAYYDNHEKGIYYCAGCGLPLFSSETKFESGTGWPSFYQPLNTKNVEVSSDNSIGYERDEVHCARCGGHLGHVFNDAPQTPTGLRYCMDSNCFIFKKK